MKQTEYLVDSEWLLRQLDNPQVVIVDCRFQLIDSNWGEFQYRQSHILKTKQEALLPNQI